LRKIALSFLFDLEQAVGPGHGQRLQQQGIEYAKNDDVGANAHRQGEDRGDGKAWRAPQLARRVAQVAGDVVQIQSGIRRSHALPSGGSVSEPQPCFAPRIVGRHAARHVLVHAHG